jgi:hypothetical protein
MIICRSVRDCSNDQGAKKGIRKGSRIVCKNYCSRKDGTCIWNGTQQGNGGRDVATLWFFPGI